MVNSTHTPMIESQFPLVDITIDIGLYNQNKTAIRCSDSVLDPKQFKSIFRTVISHGIYQYGRSIAGIQNL